MGDAAGPSRQLDKPQPLQLVTMDNRPDEGCGGTCAWMKPLVGVVMPALVANHSRCLDSVLSQNHSALQVVVRWTTAAPIRWRACRPPPGTPPPDRGIRKIRGVSAAETAPWSSAREVCQFVDSDDSPGPGRAPHMVQRAEQDDSDLVVGALPCILVISPR